MRGPAVRPIVIAAGGTGGHLFPAEALAAALVARGRRVVLMTDARTAGRAGAAFEGRERLVISGAGIAGRGVRRGLAAVAALAAGTLQARRAFEGLNAAAVVGFGGYPSVAPVLAAATLARPRRPAVLLHEQNAVLGRANRFLARRADVLALGFADTARVPAGVATVVTGNPVRPAILAAAAGATTPRTLLVLGGSLGARVFSDVVPEAVARLAPARRGELSIVQQCRAEDIERVRSTYAGLGVAAELSVFFADVASLLAGARLVIARAGASTVAELAAVGRPAILVPLPHAIDDHQSANARALAEAGGATVMAQVGFTPEALAEVLERLLADPSALDTMAAAAIRVGHGEAAATLADLVEQHMRAEPAPRLTYRSDA